MTISLALADDHPIILEGLEQLFRTEPDFEIVARCTDGEQAIAALRELNPDVLILDIRMPNKDGIEVLRELKKDNRNTKVVLLTAALDDARLLEAFRLGVDGLVLKEMAPRLLLQCVRKVVGGEQWWDSASVSAAIRKLLEREAGVAQVASVLTPREVEITRMVASGLRNKEIATRLSITEGTVKIHLHSIYEKLRVDGRVALTLFARDNGLV